MTHKIELFDRQSTQVLIDAVNRALEQVADVYDLHWLKVESAKFSPVDIGLKITGKTKGDMSVDGVSLNEIGKKFFLQHHGLPERFVTDPFVMHGQEFVFDHTESRNHKYPVIAWCEAEQRYYKFSVEEFTRILEDQ